MHCHCCTATPIMATFDTQLGTVHQPTVFFPPAVHACYCRRCKVTQRSVLPVSQAAAQQQQSTTKEWSQQDTTKALQYQLDRSAKQTPATARQEHRSEEYEKDLVQRQRSAREWITPWLTVKARSRSIDTMATLRNSTSGLSAQQQDTALKRLLGQSWQVAAAHPVAVDGDDEEDDDDDEDEPNKVLSSDGVTESQQH